MKLEVLPAEQGDCLLLHSDGGGLILIDGGPAGVSGDTLIPRLEELRQERIDSGEIAEDDPLDIDLVVVSHVDDDHINGIIDLFRKMKVRAERSQKPLFRVKDLWHNSFDRLLGNDETGALLSGAAQFGAASTGDLEALVEDAEEGFNTDHAMILASVKQGDELRGLAEALGIPINGAFNGQLIQTTPGQTITRTVAGIEFVVLGPQHDELVDLQKAYDEWLEDQPFAERTPAAMLAGLDDESVANLSSIVLLSREGGRSFLLTGDARSDKVLGGLKDSGLCGDGQSIAVDVLKMPHHGSIRNLDDEGDFLRRVTAPAYVFSGNGEHGNPDRETLELLAATLPGVPLKLHLTYPVDEIDPQRKKEYDHERAKELKKQAEGKLKPGKQVRPEWSADKHSLAALIATFPANVEVVEPDGSIVQL